MFPRRLPPSCRLRRAIDAAHHMLDMGEGFLIRPAGLATSQVAAHVNDRHGCMATNGASHHPSHHPRFPHRLCEKCMGPAQSREATKSFDPTSQRLRLSGPRSTPRDPVSPPSAQLSSQVHPGSGRPPQHLRLPCRSIPGAPDDGPCVTAEAMVGAAASSPLGDNFLPKALIVRSPISLCSRAYRDIPSASTSRGPCYCPMLLIPILPMGTDHKTCARRRHQAADSSSLSCGTQFHRNAQGEYSLKRARLEAYDQVHQARSPSPSHRFTGSPVVPDHFCQDNAACHQLVEPSPILYGRDQPCLMEDGPPIHDSHPHVSVPACGFPLPPDCPSLPSLGSPPVASSYPQSTQVPVLRSFAPSQSPPSPLVDPSVSPAPSAALGTIGSPPFLDPASFQEAWYHDIVPSHGLTDVVPRGGRSKASSPNQQSSPSILPPVPRGLKRGPFQDANLRRQTAQTREIGSCIRCRMQRIRCESNPDAPSGPCLTCQRLAGLSSARFPCLRYKITDIKLYYSGEVPGSEWTRRWNTNSVDPIHDWASSVIKVVRISEGLCNKYIELPVREFVPQHDDKLEQTWDCRGVKKSIRLPPYALADLEDGIKAYGNYIPGVIGHALKKLSGPHDGLLYLTYRQACQIFKDSATPTKSLELLDSMFMLWMSTRLSTMPAYIVGEETLGMGQYLFNDTRPDQGKIPVPPALGAQLQFILIHNIQKRLRKDLLNRLQKMIYRGNRDAWLVTYLVTFILLHNAALLMAHDASGASVHGMQASPPPNPAFTTTTPIQSASNHGLHSGHLFVGTESRSTISVRTARVPGSPVHCDSSRLMPCAKGANILLAHFHYCSRSFCPLSDDCKDQTLRTQLDLDDDKIQFVKQSRAFAKQYESDWAMLRKLGMYENDYFFVSQLFEKNWQPRSPDWAG
ncbi:Uncharacterized protein TPAR_06826 [Tolypocladium paradoxum]|uniref:Zn(2)-C6 fungal-type domain-containing protein n=1 Tax=Tolypocladium paradoxum TaxID=94208 RepID=A0A2S4KS11_9HYPO|nr:Uncharacterized protein TPAR_06826 [Tolypocladium paradoxum]